MVKWNHNDTQLRQIRIDPDAWLFNARKRQREEGLQAARCRCSAKTEWEPTACRHSPLRRGKRRGSFWFWDHDSWNEGLSRDWAGWRFDCWWVARPRRGEGQSLAITANWQMYFCFLKLLANILFLYSYTQAWMFIHIVLFISLSKTIWISVFVTY